MKKFFIKFKDELLSAAMIVAWAIWITIAMFELRASSGAFDGDIKEIKEDVKFIREYLITK